MKAKYLFGSAALALLMSASVASAQTTTDSTTTPGTPNTGAGDMHANTLMLGVSALAAIGGAAYLARRYIAE